MSLQAALISYWRCIDFSPSFLRLVTVVMWWTVLFWCTALTSTGWHSYRFVISLICHHVNLHLGVLSTHWLKGVLFATVSTTYSYVVWTVIPLLVTLPCTILALLTWWFTSHYYCLSWFVLCCLTWALSWILLYCIQIYSSVLPINVICLRVASLIHSEFIAIRCIPFLKTGKP